MELLQRFFHAASFIELISANVQADRVKHGLGIGPEKSRMHQGFLRVFQYIPFCKTWAGVDAQSNLYRGAQL